MLLRNMQELNFETILTDEEARKIAIEKKIEVKENTTRGEIISLFFEEFCEEYMVQPTFVTKHPVEISPLLRKILRTRDILKDLKLLLIVEKSQMRLVS